MTSRRSERSSPITCIAPWQHGQSATALPALPAAPLAHLWIRFLRFGVVFGNRLLEVLERKVQLVGIELLRAPAELHPLQLADEVAKALVLVLQALPFGALGGKFRAHRQYRGAQAPGVVREIVGQPFECRRHGRFVARCQDRTTASCCIAGNRPRLIVPPSAGPGAEHAPASNRALPTAPPAAPPTAALRRR